MTQKKGDGKGEVKVVQVEERVMGKTEKRGRMKNKEGRKEGRESGRDQGIP